MSCRPVAARLPLRARALARSGIVATFVVALGACASGGSSAPSRADESIGMRPSERRETLMIEGTMLQYFPSAGVAPIETELAVPVARAWQVLPDVYEQLGLKMGEISGASRQIGTGVVKVQGRVGKLSMGRIIDCGSASGISNADSYAINLLVRTQIVPARDTTATTVRTLLLASGRQAATAGGGSVSCPSTGELERQIANLVKERAATKG